MIKDKVERILNWHRKEVIGDTMQAVALLRAEFARLHTAEARNEFFEAIESALRSEPLRSKSDETKYHIHLVLIHVWAADGPTSKLVSTVLSMFKPDNADVQLRWVNWLYSSFRFALVQNALRFDDSTLKTINEWCATHANSEHKEVRETTSDLMKTTRAVEYEKYRRKLLGRATSSAALPSLADLPNREILFRDLQKYLDESVVCSAIFIDLDNFKQVNDQISHAAGNNCLENTNLRIGRVIFGKGTLYRYGGDEFAVIVPNFDIHEAAATAQRLRAVVQQTYEPGNITVTASVGVACSEQQEIKSAQVLIDAADEAMHISKFTGKNRVTTFPPSTELIKEAEENWKRVSRQR